MWLFFEEKIHFFCFVHAANILHQNNDFLMTRELQFLLLGWCVLTNIDIKMIYFDMSLIITCVVTLLLEGGQTGSPQP